MIGEQLVFIPNIGVGVLPPRVVKIEAILANPGHQPLPTSPMLQYRDQSVGEAKIKVAYLCVWIHFGYQYLKEPE